MANNLRGDLGSLSSSAKTGIKWDTKSLMLGLTQLDAKMVMALKMFAETEAISLRSYAQNNRPWTDRSGNAKKSLNTQVTIIPEGVRISLAHGVDYGLWLELANEQNYAILEPTIRLKGPDVAEHMRGLLMKIKGV